MKRILFLFCAIMFSVAMWADVAIKKVDTER